MLVGMDEHWQSVVGYEGYYEVSDQGNVRSLERTVPHQRTGFRTIPARMMRTHLMAGYPTLKLCRDNQWRRERVHVLVLEAFVGPRPDGCQACHHNDIRTDNRLVNLRWDSPPKNMQDAVRNGRHRNARKTHCKYGHEFTPDNVYVTARGTRACRTCHREREREKWRELNKTSRPRLCAFCGGELLQQATGRARRTCSDQCRQQLRQRLAKERV